MSSPDKYYTVSRMDDGLVCECPDRQYRKSNCKHIHIILNIIKQGKEYTNNEFRIIERSKLNLCKYFSSDNIKKDGFRINKCDKLQSFKCLECKRKFTSNFGFEKIIHKWCHYRLCADVL